MGTAVMNDAATPMSTYAAAQTAGWAKRHNMPMANAMDADLTSNGSIDRGAATGGAPQPTGGSDVSGKSVRRSHVDDLGTWTSMSAANPDAVRRDAMVEDLHKAAKATKDPAQRSNMVKVATILDALDIPVRKSFAAGVSSFGRTRTWAERHTAAF